MITREQVLALIDAMPDRDLSARPDGTLAWSGGRHVFVLLAPAGSRRARLWSGDMGLAPALRARPQVFPTIDEHRFRVSFDVALGEIDPEEFAELLLESYAIRCGRRRAAAVDEERFFDPVRSPDLRDD